MPVGMRSSCRHLGIMSSWSNYIFLAQCLQLFLWPNYLINLKGCTGKYLIGAYRQIITFALMKFEYWQCYDVAITHPMGLSRMFVKSQKNVSRLVFFLPQSIRGKTCLTLERLIVVNECCSRRACLLRLIASQDT